jgi:glucose/mannose-6-phosphate isomerase
MTELNIKFLILNMNLDNLNLYKKLDTGHVAESIELLPGQVKQVLDEAHLIKIPVEYSNVKNVVINGMGGSNLGARIIKSVFSPEMKIPIEIVPGYEVPGYVGKDTLYVISSYSGTTEEPLSVYNEVKKRGAKIIAITENSPKSKLLTLMTQDNIPGYAFTPKSNPSGQPRLALGYAIFGLAMLLSKVGLFELQAEEIKRLITEMEIHGRKLKVSSKTKSNPAKKIASETGGAIPVLIGAEFLSGNLHALRNQINECSKNFSTYLEIPDLNHYAMEGLSFPKSNKKDLAFIFFESDLFSARVQKRMALTKQVVKKNGIKIVSYKFKGKTCLAQSFELLQTGAWVSYYLGILNQVDPVKIPWVDWFKKQLG